MTTPRAGIGSRAIILLLASSALSCAVPAWAQTPPQQQAVVPGQTAPELNPAGRMPPRPAPKDTDVFAPEPPGPCPLADSNVQVTLNSVTLRGSTAVPADDFKGAYAEYLGKPQSVSVICAIRDRAARTLFDAGILARVEIPEQRIAGGALVLDVIEAHVVNVRVRGDVGPAQAAVERYVEQLRGMKPFDMTKAQRYLLLASDIPGLRVRAAIKPSVTPERGAVDIDVTVARDGMDLVANVQNLGSKVVGRWGGLARGDFYSTTSYGESTSLVLFHTLDSNEQWVVQLVESARLGANGLIGRGSLVYGEGRPGDVLKPLGLKSRSVTGNLELSYPVIRMRRENLNLSGGLDLIDQQAEVTGAGTLSHDKLHIAYARADGDLRTEAFGLPMQLQGFAAVRQGVGSSQLAGGLANPDAWALRGSGELQALLTPAFTGIVRVEAQYANDHLVPFEQMSLGNLSIGRGYDPASVIGDKGASAALELHYAPFAVHPQVQAAPYLFFDTGFVRSNVSGASSRSLRSIGAGVMFRIANRANLEVIYAYPLEELSAGGPKPDSRLLISLTASVL
jgi:hemolysin activation/secretion protein